MTTLNRHDLGLDADIEAADALWEEIDNSVSDRSPSRLVAAVEATGLRARFFDVVFFVGEVLMLGALVSLFL